MIHVLISALYNLFVCLLNFLPHEGMRLGQWLGLMFLGQLFDRVCLIKPVSNVRP